MSWRRDSIGTVITQSQIAKCTANAVAAGAVLIVDDGLPITVSRSGVVIPQCTGVDFVESVLSVYLQDSGTPFYASASPQVYVTGGATVVAWILFLLLLTSPRTYPRGYADSGAQLAARRGLISGATGGASVSGTGSRPWLQKVAALGVAVSLTIATTDTFRVARRQYEEGFVDAVAIRTQVEYGFAIGVSRILSNLFIWLAQLQTLIRVFPRHREKIIIKWTGLAMILLDVVFSGLTLPFLKPSVGQRRQFVNPIAALSYLFQIAISLLYGAWMLYYVWTKRRYAFYHVMMWNISVIAVLSVVSLITPIAFFIIDLANDDIAGWGDYCRWVGAAAASIIVWEWVERIEALERDDKRDGILGREIFDGDEMINNEVYRGNRDVGTKEQASITSGIDTTSETRPSASKRVGGALYRSNVKRGSHQSHTLRMRNRGLRSIVKTLRPATKVSVGQDGAIVSGSPTDKDGAQTHQTPHVDPSAMPASPGSHHSPAEEDVGSARALQRNGITSPGPSSPNSDLEAGAADEETSAHSITKPVQFITKSRLRWQGIKYSLGRNRTTPPAEIREATVIRRLQDHPDERGSSDITTSAAATKSKSLFPALYDWRVFGKNEGARGANEALSVTVVPARQRGPVWTPDLTHSRKSPAKPSKGIGHGAPEVGSGDTNTQGPAVDQPHSVHPGASQPESPVQAERDTPYSEDA